MAQNRIAHFRKASGLTQRSLADLAGTSQQQVQRIEGGNQGVRLELAMKIAQALERDIGEVFPALAQPASRSRKSIGRTVDAKAEQWLEAGLDPDPAQRTVRFFARDGRLFEYDISSQDKDRLERAFQRNRNATVVFETPTLCVSLNLKHIAVAQFLFDLGETESTSSNDDDFQMRVHLAGGYEPIVFSVEPDEQTLEEDDSGASSQLQRLFFSLEMGLDDEVVFFDDEDAERAYINPADVVAIEVPLLCCNPALWQAHLDGLEEDRVNENPEEANRAAS
jgi:transcriptional regulator with XRE-family HTH domain